MSGETLSWAMEQKPTKSEAKFVLVMMSNSADMCGYWLGDIDTLANDTCQSPSTVLLNIDLLIDEGFIVLVGHPHSSGERRAIYKLAGEFAWQPTSRVELRKSLSQRKRLEVFKADNHTCRYCGETEGDLGIDHILPVSRGGTDDFENLAVCCRPCNSKKGTKTLEEWRG